MAKFSRTTGFVRTTAIGGAFFLLPLIVVGYLISKIVPIVEAIIDAINSAFPHVFDVPGGLVLLSLLACLILVLLCFVLGLLAERSLVRSVSDLFERNLMLVWPKYAVIKENMSDKIGGKNSGRIMKPVLVEFDDSKQIGFETARVEDVGLVAVYLPGSPDTWSGSVTLVEPSRVKPLQAGFGDVVAISEQLGRGFEKCLRGGSQADQGDASEPR